MCGVAQRARSEHGGLTCPAGTAVVNQTWPLMAVLALRAPVLTPARSARTDAFTNGVGSDLTDRAKPRISLCRDDMALADRTSAEHSPALHTR
jgi:hypothetical protein